MKETFDFIANIIPLLVFFGTIIFAVANTIWKKQCEEKYKISADFFTYANKTRALFWAAVIISLNITMLSIIYLDYQDSLYNIKTSNIKEFDGFNHELIVCNKDNAINYLYNSNRLFLKNKESPNVIYEVNFFKGNRCYLKDFILLIEQDSTKFNNINNLLELKKEFNCLKFENNINKDEFINTILQVPNKFKRSVIIKYVYYNSLIKNKYSTPVYYIDRKNSNNLVAFKKTDVKCLSSVYICIYIFVICVGIYLFYLNILKKYNSKLINMKLHYIYLSMLALGIVVSYILILNYNRNNYLNNCNNLIIVSILIISILSIIFGKYQLNRVQNKISVMIFCAVLGALITFYTLSFLDILIYILFNFYLLDIIAYVIIQTLGVMIGLIIIVVAYANLFINSIILDLEPKYKFIHLNNKNNYYNIPKDLAVICEYKNKFLSVRYENYGDELIVLYTDEYWFINPNDCTVKEESFKKELVVRGNDKLKLSTLDAITRAEKNNIEELKYSGEPIILYNDKETDKKSNIPQKDRHGLIINKNDYKIFKFTALLSDNNSELNNEVLKKYDMCLIKKGFKLEDINNEMLGLDTEYVLWYLRYKNKFCIKNDTVNAYFVKNGMEILFNEDNKNEPLPIYFKFLVVINNNTVKTYLVQKYMDIKKLCELLNITEQDIDRIENYESNMVIVQIVDKEKDTSNKNAIDKDTKTKPKEKSQSQNKAQKGNKNK